MLVGIPACSPSPAAWPTPEGQLPTMVNTLLPTGSPKIQQNPTVSAPSPDTDTATLPQATLPPTFTTNATNFPQVLWVAEYVPKAIVTYIEGQLGEDFEIARKKSEATLFIDVGSENALAEWVYALVAPFPTIPDGVTVEELRQAWQGKLDDGFFAGAPLLMDEVTYKSLRAYWGAAAKPEGVQIVSSEELLELAWDENPSWAIIPFSLVEPRWKVLEVDGLSPIQKNFDPSEYFLTIPFGLSGATIPEISAISNRYSTKLTDIMLTGVTALVRGTAYTMEHEGILHPGEDIVSLTRQVDFLHVNNEVPFTPDCPFPNINMKGMVFCSDVRYIALLESIGTDIIELTGDHFSDQGAEGTIFTLDLYDQYNLPYYGGGRNLEDGRKALLVEHNNNRIAFLGCNAKNDEYYAPADEDTPGAVPCDFEWLEKEILHLKDAGYLVIMTFQHIEYYSYEAQPKLVQDFGRIAEAGADIISGSQSHQAHGFAFQNKAFIHYGLGNLFFDQFAYCGNLACDYGFMDRHVIYNGRHISTELIPIRFIDMSRPRPMYTSKKRWFMEMIFYASGWDK